MATLDEVIESFYYFDRGKRYEKYKVKCKCCDKIVEIVKSRLKRFGYCSKECQMKAMHPPCEYIKFNCQYCGIEHSYNPSKYARSKTHFCSHECADKYRSIIKTVYNKCVSCEKWFPVQKARTYQFCCSIECQGVWQSKSLVGDKANNYKSNITEEMRTHKCDWCGDERLLLPHDIKKKSTMGKKYFCSKKCYREWYAKDWSQQASWKEEARVRALTMLADGTFNKTDTLPQRILNSLLDEIDIKYINEYTCLKVSIDNYLIDHNLMIEVHGRYWHCDPRYYNTVGYQRQYDRIISDKRKKAAVKSKYGIDILYLWEDDLVNNLDMCNELVKQYVDDKGILDNYHSLNYILENNKLKLIDNLILPYSDYNSDSLHEIFIPVTGKKRSNKQLDKWLTFKCDYCGKEREQLIAHYNNNKTHCCSKECSYKLRKSI